MDEKYIEIRKTEINIDAQKMKDKFIDDMIRRANEFTQDWSNLIGKLSALNQEQTQSDKLNK